MRARKTSCKSILILEDDTALAASLKKLLSTYFSLNINYTSDADRACEIIDQGHVEILIADWLLEGGQTSLGVIEYVHQYYPQTKVLMLTQKKRCHHRIKAYKTGADAYLSKPFDNQELLLVLSKMLKSYKLSQPDTISSSDVSISPSIGEVRAGNQKVVIRPKEMLIFRVLFINRPHVISKQQLLDLVWPNLEKQPKMNTVEVYIRRLRQLLSPLNIRICNRRGYGYYVPLESGKVQ